jgi:hypothetical protein
MMFWSKTKKLPGSQKASTHNGITVKTLDEAKEAVEADTLFKEKIGALLEHVDEPDTLNTIMYLLLVGLSGGVHRKRANAQHVAAVTKTQFQAVFARQQGFPVGHAGGKLGIFRPHGRVQIHSAQHDHAIVRSAI